MDERQVSPETNNELRFRIYQPVSEELQALCHPINVYPTETIEKLNQIIDESHKNSPNIQDSKNIFYTEKLDSDLKRMMRPQIDDLKLETLEILKQLRSQGKY